MPQSDPSDRGAQPPDVLDEVEHAIATLTQHADPVVRETVERLLKGIDAVHRAGLTHLVEAIEGLAGNAFLHRLVRDPAIRLLFMSYNLIAADRQLLAEEALDAVRGHLHDHGVDVEVLEVVGSVVYVRLHPARHAASGHPLTPDAVRQDLEAALRAGLLGFQELVFRDAAPAAAAFIPLSHLRGVNRPVYHDALDVDALPRGFLKAVTLDGIPILLANVAGEILAVRNRCGDSPFPLEFGVLDGTQLQCPWHGCRYDLRTGRRLDAEDSIQVFPVAVADGRIRVAIGVEPAPDTAAGRRPRGAA